MAAVNEETINLLTEIQPDEFRSILEIPDIVEWLLGYPHIIPIRDRWIMVGCFVSGSNSWQVVETEGGMTWVGEEANISDVDIQIYQNGWIIWARTNTDVKAVHRPDIVKRYKEMIAS